MPALTEEFKAYFRHEWIEAVAMTQYYMVVYRLPSIPIMPKKVIKEEDDAERQSAD